MQHINSYFIEKYQSDIVHLLFNTKDRWMPYHQLSDHWYHIGESCRENFVEIAKEDLPLDKENHYLKVETQEKDQISFYWIPYTLLGIDFSKDRPIKEEKLYFKEFKPNKE